MKSEIFSIGNAKLQRIHHDENLLPDRGHAGFGSLLFDTDGKLVLHDGTRTWLYTAGLFEAPVAGQRDWYGQWVSHVREFDTESLVSEEKKFAVGPVSDDRWAIIHHAVKVSEDLYVVFYSSYSGVKAAVSDKPDGLFQTDSEFQLGVTSQWEIIPGKICSLESAGGHVKIEESSDHFLFWLIYDSYHVEERWGNLGWVKVRVDKHTGGVALVGKHQNNPLNLLPENYIAARAGGNVSTDVRLGDQYAFFYFTRPNRNIIMLAAALSPDPLFQNITHRVEFDTPLGSEKVIEKFEAYMVKNILYIIYENELETGHWGTGIRLYRIVE